jgi:hypothetical protein
LFDAKRGGVQKENMRDGTVRDGPRPTVRRYHSVEVGRSSGGSWLKLYIFIAVLLLARTTARIVADNPEMTADQLRLLEAIRASALKYTQKLPDFICTQTTHRQVSYLGGYDSGLAGVSTSSPNLNVPGTFNRGSADVSDVLEEKLTYFSKREHYEVLTVNGLKATGKDHRSFQGAISAGEFGSALSDIFDSQSGAVFSWNKTEDIHGTRAYVLEFRVPKTYGMLVIHSNPDRQIIAGYEGRVIVNADTLEVLQIKRRVELPPDFPIHMIETNVEYRPIEIAGKQYILPFHCEVRLKDNSNLYVNRIDFRNYHKFAADSTIHYDSDTPPQ